MLPKKKTNKQTKKTHKDFKEVLRRAESLQYLSPQITKAEVGISLVVIHLSFKLNSSEDTFV